jgi:GAF domain-containing protein
MPITTASGETIGVAQLINKQNGGVFTQQDEKFFASFLAYCGIALRNAMMYEEISLAKAKDEILLRCASEIFRSLDIQILS